MSPFHYITYIYCFSGPNFASSCLKPSIKNTPSCINRLCLSLLSIKYIVYDIWTFCCTGNKAFMKVYQWFYWTSNPQCWGKSQSVYGGPKAVLFCLAKFLLEALAMLIMIHNLTVTLIWTVVLLRSWYQMGVQFNKEWTKISMAISQCGTPRVFM